ncbi:MAG TPA: dethiobiotin synthase [Chitinophagaceae bacterium]|nr:dethiobiotin synthase [Chitinophagaceae bacterium]
MKPIFITGIGTGVGKTIWSAIVTEALCADYWKPVQAGFEDGTDRIQVSSLLTNTRSVLHPERYMLALPASPHIAARDENILIETDEICAAYHELRTENEYCVIEGAGGLMVPLNDREFVADLASKLDAMVLLVSRNYLGSINHSILTSMAARSYGLKLGGWLFNDRFMDYEDELVNWSGLPKIGSIPFEGHINDQFVREQAAKLEPVLRRIL